MDAIEFFKEKNRMCEYFKQGSCSDCGLSIGNNKKNLYCNDFISNYPEKTVEIVEQWSKSHQQKTILDDFRDKYPNAQLEIDGTPKFCPVKLGYKTKPCGGKCDICWHTPLEEK